MFNILQFNVQSLTPNKNSIEFFMNTKKIDILCLAEIWKVEKNFKILNYNLVIKTNLNGYGGVAIALRKSINYKEINYCTEHDILIIETTNLYNRSINIF